MSLLKNELFLPFRLEHNKIVLTKGLNKGIESREIDESTARKKPVKSTFEK